MGACPFSGGYTAGLFSGVFYFKLLMSCCKFAKNLPAWAPSICV